MGAAAVTHASPSLQNLVRAIGGDPAQAGSARYAYLNKLDSQIQDLAAGKSQRTAVAGIRPLSGVTVTPGGKALVDVYVSGDVPAAAGQLRALGMDVTAISTRAPERMVEGYMPLGEATKIAALSTTRGVVSIVGAGTDVGSVTSEGDAAEHGPQARALGPNGSGVTVGVMSDSINDVGNGIADSQSTGDLPANVTDLGDAPSGEDEGRAMAEIIYDEAPGITNMVFDTGGTGAANKAAHIAQLVSHGAKVIADDTFYLTEPFFQDGAVAQAVDQAVASGTAYIASAGNRAHQSWEGTFTPGAGNLNDFGGGDTRQAVVDLPGGGASLTLVLQWNEPWGADTDSFSVNVYGNNSLVTTATPSAGFPLVSVDLTNNGASPAEVEIEIHRTAGTGTPRLKYIVANNFGTFAIKEHNTSSPTIDPDAASARGSLAVAAECWSTSASDCPLGPAGLHAPENFSSRGPVTRLRAASGALLATPDVRQKPNLAGADAVSTSVPDFAPFFGTSAAAPSVTGVAALALSAKPSLTVPQLYALLTDPRDAIACTVPDPLDACGAGFVQADRVVMAAGDTTPPAIQALLSPSAPNGAHGWFTTPVAVSWSVSDIQSPIVTSTGCGATTISARTILTCSASSIGGTSTVPLPLKVDTSPPSRPAISGIGAKRYRRSKLPAAGKIHCAAADPESGVDSCTVTGFSNRLGSHTLTATATNDAGLSSTSKLTFTVAGTCKVPKLKGKSLAAAKRALKHAHCKLGKTKPAHPSSRQKVAKSSPKAGALKLAGTKVKLTFGG